MFVALLAVATTNPDHMLNKIGLATHAHHGAGGFVILIVFGISALVQKYREDRGFQYFREPED